MLFGAGNVVYPLIAGQYAGDKYIFAICSFLISSILFAFIGVLAMVLFEGDYTKFFNRMGKKTGAIMTIFIMCLIGPLGAIPRIVTVSYGSIHHLFPNMSLTLFSLFSCVAIFFLTLKKNRMIDIIGYVLTPMLLGSLVLIIISAFFNMPPIPITTHNTTDVLVKGFTYGNQTMDLLGAICFSTMIFNFLQTQKTDCEKTNNKRVFFATLKAGCIGLFLLSLIYIGFVKVSAHFGNHINVAQSSEVLTNLASYVLGSKATILSSFAISLACITTAIALSAVFTDFLYEKIFLKKIHYKICLAGSMVTTFLLSTLNFNQIMNILNPILQVFYPVLIVLSLINILHKFFGFKMVKTPVYITLILSLLWQLHVKQILFF
ncbi:MAG: hypothetical protein AMS24_04795 [Chlamydiae bacterium SM23_39]|nr:MAG: hypothetical protein AMS24_04795 [Chlamydiae bacterium SM23_39]